LNEVIRNVQEGRSKRLKEQITHRCSVITLFTKYKWGDYVKDDDIKRKKTGIKEMIN